MAKHVINANSSFTIEVNVRESDKYTESVYVKFERNYVPENVQGVSEMFFTPDQLEDLGMFLVNQANSIRTEQANRFFAKRMEQNAELERKGANYRIG